MTKRLIPLLLIDGPRLVKTTGFKGGVYLGDPVNAASIYSQKEVDEMMVVGLPRSLRNWTDHLELLREFASEAFFPLSYVGGVQSESRAVDLFRAGFDKVALCSACSRDPQLVRNLVRRFGAQSVVGFVDWVRTGPNLSPKPVIDSGRTVLSRSLESHVKSIVDLGAGEIVLQDVARDGSMRGLDVETVARLAEEISVPVVAGGGISSFEEAEQILKDTGLSAVFGGALFSFIGRHRAVLINYPQHRRVP